MKNLAHINSDTIIATCTPPGPSPAGVLRLSGSDALSLAEKLFTPDSETAFHDLPDWCAANGMIKLALGGEERKTPAIVFLMRAPKSYTCENVVELMLPGSPVIMRAAEREFIRLGARMAEPGEFTFRAFLNGRIDLGQAEAVERVVCAASEDERKQALSRLTNEVTRRVAAWRDDLLHISANIEAALDFEEEELEEDTTRGLAGQLAELEKECLVLAGKAVRHRPEREGVRVLFCGLTNAGKSSLINSLLEREASIVSPETSTTRDLLSHEFTYNGIRFLFDDAPGFDSSAGSIAAAASERASQSATSASLICLVVDASNDCLPELKNYLAAAKPGRLTLALNKSDLPPAINAENISRILSETDCGPATAAISVSAATGDGTEKLLREIELTAVGDLSEISHGVLSAREAAEIEEAARACSAARLSMESGDGAELVAEELRQAYSALSRAMGEGYGEDILSNIFSRFCIGK